MTPVAQSTAACAGPLRVRGPAFWPECPSCRRCQSLRVHVDEFRPTESQQRAWKRNIDQVVIRIGSPSASREKLQLLARFHAHGHRTKGWPVSGEPDFRVFVANPFRTQEWSYLLGDRLVGVRYVDALPVGQSAIYFFHDPDENRRSLGTFNVLAMIASARARRLPHVYLGYYVDGCRSLDYKARFRPHDLLRADGRWEGGARPA